MLTKHRKSLLDGFTSSVKYNRVQPLNSMVVNIVVKK